ncbi:uncharacterized protein LOC127258706 [Andrographis paniculata]|uniref:uncharacterized protein LOC127258706 n=1 Tax=Andrographis paniculata TaxID=175694 RepID=UPI0021E866F4|nr:uncharacterized protein LOC127258706 [Andrographis paniculata]
MAERVPENVAVAMESAGEEASGAAVKPAIDAEKKKKKQGGAYGIFSAALSVLRKKSSEDKETKKTLSKQKSTNWKKLVGALRPLCLQQAAMESADEHTLRRRKQASSAEKKTLKDFVQPRSPASSCSSGTMSRYASATSLWDQDDSSSNSSGDEMDPNEVFDALTEDEMIDAKADEFIAQFYRDLYNQNASHPSPRCLDGGISLDSRNRLAASDDLRP